MRAWLFIFVAVTLTACSHLVSEHGNGDRITKTYDLEPYDEIEVSGGYDIYLVQSDDHDVTITVDENLIEEVNIYVRGSRLVIESVLVQILVRRHHIRCRGCDRHRDTAVKSLDPR